MSTRYLVKSAFLQFPQQVTCFETNLMFEQSSLPFFTAEKLQYCLWAVNCALKWLIIVITTAFGRTQNKITHSAHAALQVLPHLQN